MAIAVTGALNNQSRQGQGLQVLGAPVLWRLALRLEWKAKANSCRNLVRMLFSELGDDPTAGGAPNQDNGLVDGLD